MLFDRYSDFCLDKHFCQLLFDADSVQAPLCAGMTSMVAAFRILDMVYITKED
jgi:hypothetical protein